MKILAKVLVLIVSMYLKNKNKKNYYVLTTDTQSGSNKTRKGVLPKNPLNLTMGPYF